MDSSRSARESAYWDAQAQIGLVSVSGKRMLTDNIDKRGQIIGHLLSACSWPRQNVLEIGVGGGLTAACLQLAVIGKWHYIGTDVSRLWAENACSQFGLTAVQADVLHLPGKTGQYTRVIALDALEHVHPDDRAGGYAEIARLTAVGGLLLINMPLNEELYSGHDNEFDHPFDLSDLHRIELAGFMLTSYKKYMTSHEQQPRPLAFAVLERV